MKKHLPAWVISGALNLGLVTAALIIDRMSDKSVAQTSDAITEVSLEDKADETNLKDLTNPDVGLDSELPFAIASANDAKVTLKPPDAVNEPIGSLTAKDTPPMD